MSRCFTFQAPFAPFVAMAALVALVAGLVSPAVRAEKVIIYREGQLVNPADVAAVLGRTRSIRLLDEAPEAPAKFVTTAAVTPVKAHASATGSARASGGASASAARDGSSADASALSLPLRFAFDSADILPAAQTQLDAVAEGIKLLGPRSLVMVEGHTDAVGSDAYNLELSRARARAVRDYLVQRHGIDAARLQTVGYGKGRPVEDADAHAAVNRRVQFRGG
jgi:outer membrane protein OmpA-like peptidoglycan-associated protein